jgi:predicted lysophospholipase L1 biosynthesis ABC-type transport system permease subunit
MGVKFRSWWKKTSKPIKVLGLIAVLVAAIALIFVEVILFGTVFKGKTLWDWLQLLIIPVVLALGGYLFTFTINRNERKAADRHRTRYCIR